MLLSVVLYYHSPAAWNADPSLIRLVKSPIKSIILALIPGG